MANNCLYDMKVVGDRNAINELVRIMQYKEQGCSMFRVFAAELVELRDNYAIISGDCAWSVFTCMFDSEHGFITLPILSKEYRLEIEVFSSEPGIGFQEHYIIKNGTIVCDICEDYNEYHFDEYEYDGETTEERFGNFCNEYNLNISINDLDENSDYCIGGVDGYMDWTI